MRAVDGQSAVLIPQSLSHSTDTASIGLEPADAVILQL